jgi:hypothetical protein
MIEIRRKIDKSALFWLLAVLAGVGAALWHFWLKQAADPSIHCGGRLASCRTEFGYRATMVILLVSPVVIWLFHKAFLSKYRRHLVDGT